MSLVLLVSCQKSFKVRCCNCWKPVTSAGSYFVWLWGGKAFFHFLVGFLFIYSFIWLVGCFFLVKFPDKAERKRWMVKYYVCLSVLSFFNQILRDIFVFESALLFRLVHKSVIIQKELNAWNMQFESYKETKGWLDCKESPLKL